MAQSTSPIIPTALYAQSLEIPGIILNIVIASALGLLIAWVYRKTHKGLSYSQSFVTALVLSTVIIAMIMMVIGDSLTRAFGAFGAFSIIRFRTAIKDARDMIYLFLALALGMAVGTRSYAIAGVSTVLVILVIYLMHRFNLGSIKKYDYIVTFHLDSSQTSQDVYRDIFNKYLKVKDLLNINTVDHGRILELSFNVRFLSENQSDAFLAELSRVTGISEVSLISAKNDIEY
ncbi:MAG: DUF4956 domain-containing protein [Candidatus Komeilibacteria bacterium]